ncbi:sodium:proton exchanger [Saccharopolyspora shandongensis]|uniref:sodium:calcium antiporter n=1 Tax=Saccharopolyspora shandongensis TaxID=418495 RepID=UPI00343CA9DA
MAPDVLDWGSAGDVQRWQGALSVMASTFLFVAGAVLLIGSAEKLIGYLAGAASRLSISVFFLAVVFTGIEFDDIVLGVALNLEDLEEVSLGLVLGTAISFTGIVLALAAIITPAAVRVPRDYLAIFAAAPLVLAAFALTTPLTAVQGVLLLGLFALFLGYILVQEFRRETPTFRSAEVCGEMVEGNARPDGESFSAEIPFAAARKRPGWANLGLAVLALAGLVVGAAAMSTGTKDILQDYGIAGTVFGATIVTLVLTIEDVFLTVEPIRKGVPAIGIGNVIGSLVFSVTAKLGVIVLSGGSIAIGPDVLRWHLPVLVAMTVLAACFLHTGRLKRWHGFALLGCYVAYWVVSFAVFDGVPVES